MRRLITLISAGRDRIIVIRRELPRTEDAGWVQAPYRNWRVLLSVRPRAVSDAIAAKSIIKEVRLVVRAWHPRLKEFFSSPATVPVKAERSEPKGSLDGWLGEQ